MGPHRIWTRVYGVPCITCQSMNTHDTANAVVEMNDNVIKWKYFPRYLPFVKGIRVNSPQRPVTLIFSWICAWIKGRVNNREAGDLRCQRSHHDVIVMMRGENLRLSDRSKQPLYTRAKFHWTHICNWVSQIQFQMNHLGWISGEKGNNINGS